MRFIDLVLFSSLQLVFVGIVQAAQLHVKSGETKVISAAEARLELDQLILEDGAMIQVADEVEHWQLFAEKVILGKDVSILAAGMAGGVGKAGASGEGKAEDCEDGLPGESGGAGGRGGKGVAISWDIKVASWGSLEIQASGGAGGAGGDGGKGQQAGEVDKCGQTRGGAGGIGGIGGDGGNGGTVRIRYSYLEGADNTVPLQKKLLVFNPGGSGGIGGSGGEGGAGTKGRYINMRTLTGSKKWIGGGKSGSQGEQGASGRNGVDGLVIVEEDLVGLVNKQIAQQQDQVARIREEIAQSNSENEKALLEQLNALKRAQEEQASKVLELEEIIVKLTQELSEFNSLKQQVRSLQQSLNSQESLTADDVKKLIGEALGKLQAAEETQ